MQFPIYTSNKGGGTAAPKILGNKSRFFLVKNTNNFQYAFNKFPLKYAQRYKKGQKVNNQTINEK